MEASVAVASVLANLNASKVLLGLSGVMVNIGSKAVINEYLTPLQEQALKGAAVRRVVVFCMFFLATRDLLLAAALATAFVVMVEGLLNERSRFCVLPGTRTRALPQTVTLPPAARHAAAAMAAALHASGGAPRHHHQQHQHQHHQQQQQHYPQYQQQQQQQHYPQYR